MASGCEPTEAHKSLVAMHNVGRLLRCYTQNIDLLEEKAGLSTGSGEDSADCVTLHGSHRFLRCCLCHCRLPWETFDESAIAGLDLPCPQCKNLSAEREKAGKRRLPIGQLMPDIVRLGQADHPDGETIARQSLRDEHARPDFLLVLGTSLKVDGPKRLVRQFAKAVRLNEGTVVYVDLQKPRLELTRLFDYCVQWDCNSFFRSLKKEAPNAFGFECATHLRGQNEPGSTWNNPVVLE